MGKKKVHKHKDLDVEIDIDLTPMIDMVFQMVMFFIIVTDFTKKEIALLELPHSQNAQDDKGEDKGRLVINITAPLPTNPAELKKWGKGRRKEANQIIVQGKKKTFVELYEWLKARGVNDARYRDKDNPNLSSRTLLIRCDGGQAFDYVKGILQVCALPAVAIYKVELATSEKVEKDK